MGPADVGAGVSALRRVPEYTVRGEENNNFGRTSRRFLRKSAAVLEVPFLKHLSVMGDVAGDDVGDCTDGDRVIAGDTATRPRLVRQVLEKRNRAQPDGPELFDQLGPGRLICIRRLDRDILFKARQRVLKSAREPECPVEEHTLAVIDVVQQFANRPLSRSVGFQTLLLRDTLQEPKSLSHLPLHRRDDLVIGYKINVFVIVGSGFGSLWSCHLGGNPNKRFAICVTNPAVCVSI